MPVNLSSLSVKAVLLDIEGTTTPVGFVYDVLFPYARKHLKEHLSANFSTPEIQQIVKMLRKEHENDVIKWAEPPHWNTESPEAEFQSILNYLYWMMDKDRKAPALKRIQGNIWEQGYRSGELQSELFPDVPPALRRWRERGLDIRIYSSGSVLAQKLLFSHTKEGDLTSLIRGFFDTRMGPKHSADSYRRIMKEMKARAGQVLFISDRVKELDAANKAGLRSVLCIRPFNSPQPQNSYLTVESFEEIVS